MRNAHIKYNNECCEDGFVVSQSTYDKLKEANFEKICVNFVSFKSIPAYLLTYNNNNKMFTLNGVPVNIKSKKLKNRIKKRYVNYNLNFGNFDYDGDMNSMFPLIIDRPESDRTYEFDSTPKHLIPTRVTSETESRN